MHKILIVTAACVSLGACGYTRADAPVSANLDSGITASNGGGQRALGNVPDIGVTNGVASQRPSNTLGKTY